jgi:hypothetical protein
MVFVMRTVFLAFMIIFSSNASAQDVELKTISNFMNKCDYEGAEPGFSRLENYCFGVLNGVFAALSHTQQICADTYVSNGAMAQVFLNWAKENPTKWERPATVGMTVAFMQSWSCD